MTALTSTLRDDYLAALLAGDGTRARHLVDEAAHDGVPAPDLYLEVLQPALYEVGKLWARGELGVAYEHYATAVTQGILGALGSRMRVPPRGGRLAVLVCSPAEQHALGVQMVADFVEGEGWEVLQLGAGIPVPDLARLVGDEQPDVVGLSTATPAMIPAALETVRALDALDPRPCIVLGGQAWADATPARVRETGADFVVRDARELVALLRERFPPVPEDAGEDA